MAVRRVCSFIPLALGLPRFLNRTLDLETSLSEIDRRFRTRQDRFLSSARSLIYENTKSPYRALLEHSGIGYGRLCRLVRSEGLEGSLLELRRRGVYLTFEEFKGIRPVERSGFRLEPGSFSVKNPKLKGVGVAGSSSGRFSQGSASDYSWGFFTEEAALERVLIEIHDAAGASALFWYPAPPGIAGLHNLLLHLKIDCPPAVWFSPSDSPSFLKLPLERASLVWIKWFARMLGKSFPEILKVTPNEGEVVSKWIDVRLERGEKVLLKTFSGLAVRIVKAASEAGNSLEGTTFFAGGESLTSERGAYLASSGGAVAGRYVATEAGLIAASCNHVSEPGLMHFYSDRLAVIPGEQGDPVSERPEPLLFTSLSENAPNVLVNVDLGDVGTISHRECPCMFGSLGLNTFLGSVQSSDKLTTEGMNIPVKGLEEVVGGIVRRMGGSPDDYQFTEQVETNGITKLIVRIDPGVKGFDEEQFRAEMLDELANQGLGGTLSADVWKSAESIVVIRETPKLSSGAKFLRKTSS